MSKATSNSIIKEHLCEMMERLLDDELFKDADLAKVEIQRALALNSIASSTLEMQRIENDKKKTVLDALKVADQFGYTIKEVKNAINDVDEEPKLIAEKVS